jgi:mRNA interferase MazF
MADFGMAGKIRPCVIVNIQLVPSDRALLALVPHTTSLQGTRFEVSIPKPFLKPGAFNIQGIANLPFPRMIRRLGFLLPPEITLVEGSLRQWIGL